MKKVILDKTKQCHLFVQFLTVKKLVYREAGASEIYMSWPKQKGGLCFSDVMRANDVGDVICDNTVGKNQTCVSDVLAK